MFLTKLKHPQEFQLFLMEHLMTEKLLPVMLLWFSCLFLAYHLLTIHFHQLVMHFPNGMNSFLIVREHAVTMKFADLISLWSVKVTRFPPMIAMNKRYFG